MDIVNIVRNCKEDLAKFKLMYNLGNKSTVKSAEIHALQLNYLDDIKHMFEIDEPLIPSTFLQFP